MTEATVNGLDDVYVKGRADRRRLRPEDVRGVTVHEAARIMAEAGPGTVLVSETVALLCRGSDLSFEDAGEHELKGVPDRWHLYRVMSGQS